MRLPTFTSALAASLRSLAEYRQALGYGDRTLPSYLAHFDRYLAARGWTLPYLTREVVEDWVASDEGLQPRSRAARLHVMRLLGRFIVQTHPETHVPGPAWRWCQSSGFRPHIYTAAEVEALLTEARRLTPIGSLRPHTYVTLLGLLYCTGLRISEALTLRLADVDLETQLLLVRESKFHKSRLLPLSLGTSNALRRYQEERKKRGFPRDPDAPLFMNERRGQCIHPVVCATFLAMARRTGVRRPAGARGPRLHDFRHTFAVHRLLEWYRDGGDVQARLPLLTDYLGHVSLVSTQVYLDITAELLHEAARRFRPPGQPGHDSQGGTL
ncbi:MAG: tyrosine-type recombinase/integrase [Dehalococcoidia bacterium]|nr:tyrosine-type recombinase/integrase [Dehalococcoidia bacterium]